MSSPSYKVALFLLALSSTGECFTSHHLSTAVSKSYLDHGMRLKASAPSTIDEKTMFFADVAGENEEPPSATSTATAVPQEASLPSSDKPPTKKSKKAPAKEKAAAATHKEGIFSPAVMAAKKVLGDDKLNKVRANAISMHSVAIKGFVGTSDSAVGQAALAQLFALADKDGNGKIDKEELAAAMEVLGFTWLKEKQINGIFKRADLDGNGTIDFEEFAEEAPKTLKTNLTKLAKKNGGDLGFLV